MNPLTADTIIAIAPGVRLEFHEGGTSLSRGDTRLDPGSHGLTVLNLFRSPQTMAEAMAQVSGRDRDPKVWMQVSAVVYGLWASGILCEAGPSAVIRAATKPLAQSGVHTQTRMLNDPARTHGFLGAIAAIVKAGDVVIDLGTGTGVLAIAAAKAGAKHVYAMEMTGMADVAEAMFKANGLSDRISIMRGRSNDLELPAGIRANVLITETVGDGPFGEGILESVADARRRLLTPDARVIPAGITVGVVPLSLPHDLLERYIFTAQNAQQWEQQYGMGFGAALRCGNADTLTSDLTVYRLRTADYLRCEILGSPVVLTRVDFARYSGTSVEAAGEVKVEKSGALHGIAMYFDLDIGAQHALSTAPAGTQATTVTALNSWRIPIWLRLQPLPVKAGDVFKVHFKYSERVAHLDVERTTGSET